MTPSHTTDEQLLAALTALGIDVPDDLGHSSHDPELRTAALWALLWRSAGAGYEESVAGPDHARAYFTGPWEWPLAEDQVRRAWFELGFAGDRLDSLTMTVPPWSVGLPHEDAPDDPTVATDGWAYAASTAVNLAQALLGPLRWMSSQRAPAAISQADRMLRRLQATLEELGDATAHPRCENCGGLQHMTATVPECLDCSVSESATNTEGVE
ncbi:MULTISPECIES: hypothetical protein [Streptomyces]|uniref:Uncharacterized protein n=1 Tax=Streptomyces virginiae TaxID=1961 RepID=A0ABZ1TS16_STRVG|nr:hypothetical protein [Streptomyces virginiae]